MKHTEGPWKLVKDSRQSHTSLVSDSGVFIAEIEGESAHARHAYAAPGQDAHGNAVLLREAPTLLAALVELVRCVRGGDETAGFSMDDALMDADTAIEEAGGL